jgi:hypothetical protein
MTDQVAIGFCCHSGWAIAVTVRGSCRAPVVLDRARVALLDERLPRQPYHAVAEDGADRAVIVAVEQDVRRCASMALSSMAASGIVAVVAPVRSIPSDLDRVLGSHALLHAAEGALYEQAVLDAAVAAGRVACLVDRRTLQPSDEIEALRGRIGPPWQKDHKFAAMAALITLERS